MCVTDGLLLLILAMVFICAVILRLGFYDIKKKLDTIIDILKCKQKKMTEIEIVSSGSQANGYLLKSADQILVLELGCKFMDYIQHLKQEEVKNVCGCCATHR